MKRSVLHRDQAPWTALARLALTGDQPAFLWRVPSTGALMLAVGRQTAWSGSGPDALLRAQRWADRILHEPLFGGQLPRAWFAATFDGEAGAGDWAGWSGVEVVVPSWMLLQRGGGLQVVLTAQTDAELQDQEARFDTWLAHADTVESGAMPDAQRRFWAEAPSDFAQRVAQAQTLLGEDLHKVVLVNCRHHRFGGGVIGAVVDKLMSSERNGIHFAYTTGDGGVLTGCTPETLVQQQGVEVAAHILAGTRRRKAQHEADQAQIDDLLHSPKDRHEHDLVATGIVEALEPWVDGIEVPDQPSVLSLDHLHHLERHLSGHARGGTGFFDLVRAMHPTPALGGYPQRSAMAFIKGEEPLKRGGFGAPFGWLAGPRHGHAAVAIRAALVRGDAACVYAGAGVVEQSDPEAERAEVDAKIRAIETELLGLSE